MITRRDFLKLGGAALLGALLPVLTTRKILAGSFRAQGRVLYSRQRVRLDPSFAAEQIGSVEFDDLLDLDEQVIGGEPGDSNHTWYHLITGGYVHSSGIQLVSTTTNELARAIPEGGQVGEVTVPYADSLWALNRAPTPGPRLYFKTTHWVDGIVSDERDGSPWYRCYDQLWNSHYYTRPQWIRLYPEGELSLVNPDFPEGARHIQVILDEQMLYAYQGAVVVLAARVSTGQDGFETPTGWFQTFHKRPTAHMVGGYDASTTFDLPGVPWDTYLTESGIAIHGTFWHNDFGVRHSHGCINLKPDAARFIYRWTSPAVPAGERLLLAPGSGTKVWIRQTRS